MRSYLNGFYAANMQHNMITFLTFPGQETFHADVTAKT